MAGEIIMAAEDNKEIDISVIIPLYRGYKYCGRLLDLLERNCRCNDLYEKCAVELVLVNDYPSEDIILDEKKRAFSIRIFRHEKNMGIHAARVTGVKNARGKYIVIFDQDDLAKDNWLYSQWESIRRTQTAICLCNGWQGRFRIIEENDVFEQKILERNNFLTMGNPIISPGQAIINICFIPEEWLNNIQEVNGSDDFLLWIMMMKKGYEFSVNREYLYYHSPERTRDSIDRLQMTESLKETLQILHATGIFDVEEALIFNKYIDPWGIYGDSESFFLDADVVKHMGKKLVRQNQKNSEILHIMRNWLNLKNQGITLSAYFKRYQYFRIAIYGMGYIGESLYYELYESNVSIAYAIDKCAIDFMQELKILRWKDEFPKVDAIVVTLAVDYDDIIEKLGKRLDCPIITIREVIFELENSC